MPRVLLCSGPGLSAGCRGNEKNIRSAVPEASIRGVHTPRESRPAGHDGHDGAVLGAVLPSPVVRPRTPGDLPALVRSLGEQQPTSSYPMRWPLPFPVEQFIVREGQERSWVVVLGGRVVGHVGVGRPRGDVDTGRRLELLADLVTGGTRVPAAVLAAVAHGELLTLQPFGTADGVVARAVSRLITIASGLDPHGLGVPEVHWMRRSGDYRAAARGFASGTPDGLAAWLVLSAEALHAGAREALAIAVAMSS